MLTDPPLRNFYPKVWYKFAGQCRLRVDVGRLKTATLWVSD